jgi:glycosyltransferase involved in cell wall biosynthesis
MTKADSASNAPSLDNYPASPRLDNPNGGRHAKIIDETGGNPPLISVVTVVRNGVGTLPRALDSVFSQDFPDIEYIVVDGQSTDGTLNILQENQNRIALWISEPDLGISDAFNKGIALSRGEIIGLLNSDDWYEPGAIREVVAEMRRTGADIACGRLQYWDGDRRTYLVKSDPAKLERGMTIGHPTVFVRRECYRKHGLFRLDFRLAMDYEWLLRAKAAGAHFAIVDRCLANMQGGGVGDRRWRNSQREVARARALHVRGADNAFAYHAYVVRRVFMGSVRRMLDAAGLGAIRRIHHRWFSPVTVTSTRDDNKH